MNNLAGSRRLRWFAAFIVAGVLAAAATIAIAQQGAANSKTPASTTKSQGSANTQDAKQGAAASSNGTALSTDKAKESYAFGWNIGKKLAQQPVDLDNATLLSGLRDALENNHPQLTEDEVKAALQQLANEASAKEEAENAKLGEANLKEGQTFLADNKSKQGVVELPSGLQYKIITAGTGPKPTASDTVVCDYKGTLINGKEFDSSYRRGQPATFPVNRVIKGWTEALQMMPVGSKWQLFIPSDLAYGSQGAGPDIGPNTTLIFEVELHSIQGK